jgi:hypothetical protein
LFTFTGDGDVMKIGMLLCQILQLTSEDGARSVIDMITKNASIGLGHHYHGITVGGKADFFLVNHDTGMSHSNWGNNGKNNISKSAIALLASPSLERTVFKCGKLVSYSSYSCVMTRHK